MRDGRDDVVGVPGRDDAARGDRVHAGVAGVEVAGVVVERDLAVEPLAVERAAARSCAIMSRPSRRCSSAASTPPGLIGTPASCRPICTPPSVPTSVRSLKWPRWPIRNTLPASLPSPAPSDMSKRSRMSRRTSSASWPSGSSTAVSEPECSRSSAHSTSSPHARTAARVAAACRWWRAKTAGRPSSASIAQGLAQPVQQVGGRACRGRSRARWPRGSASQSQYDRRAAWPSAGASSAFSLTALKPRPGGSISPFCEPATVTSTPHSSWR